ncbi:feruloyl esterase B precursor [Coniochaeta sp. 2T2.1]|nr:feruloyl esterase B precursor [Coniochaeta sp. 2T2.1]
MRDMRRVTASIPFVVTALAVPALALNCSECAISRVLASGTAGATVNYVKRVPLNGSFIGSPNDTFNPTTYSGLPSLCAVSINVPSSANTSFNFGLFMPDEWNGRIITTGNGGFGGGINWADMAAFSHYGMASMSTDTGHISFAVDGSWGLNQPEKITDWGYRAMHGSVVLSKELVQAYYSSNISYSYYASCSTGGRQGLKEIELHPDSFDGIAVGAPAWQYPNLPSSTLKQGLYNLPVGAPHHIPGKLFPVIAAEVTRQCDPQDGLRDGIVSDPLSCNFRYEELLCKPGATSNCLTSEQLDTVYQFYDDFVDVNQTFVFPGLTLGTDASALVASPNELGVDFFKFWVHEDPNWDPSTFTYADIELAHRINPGNASSDDYDLTPYRSNGGKIIMYHGLADGIIPTKSSLYFYNHVYRALLQKGLCGLDDFYRLFLIPGMNHCSGSPNAPWYIGGGSQAVTGATHSVPGFEDAKHDVILAMIRWVEQGVAPDELIATKYKEDNVAAGVELQRPLCPYPLQAKYVGSGNASDPSSWSCKGLY